MARKQTEEIRPPIAVPHDLQPMEMQVAKEIPAGIHWLYEPKWDGFRCIAFRDGDKVDLRSKNGQEFSRYFPEVVAALLQLEAEYFVLDGELMVWGKNGPSFDELLQRIHPASSRVLKLSKDTPAKYVVFDLLADNDGHRLLEKNLSDRRARLESFAKKYLGSTNDIALSPATRKINEARQWFESHGVELDGIIAKRLDMPYQSGNRKGAVKVKRIRTAECVIGGFRYGVNSKYIASLLLGLYDRYGQLHHVGFTSAFSGEERIRLTEEIQKLKTNHSFDVNVPGGPSRWSQGKENEWTPVKPVLVVEVQYDHFTDGRFRHGTKILRWRVDKPPRACTFDQLS
jgi:ATP-dependent DNA ligase